MGIYKCVREAAPVLKTGQKAKAAFYQSVFVLEGQIWAHTMIRGWSYSPSEDYGDECRDWKWSWSQIRLISFLHELYCVRSHNQNITFRSVSYTVSITKHHSDSRQYIKHIRCGKVSESLNIGHEQMISVWGQRLFSLRSWFLINGLLPMSLWFLTICTHINPWWETEPES